MTTHDEDKIIAQQARIEQLTNFIKYAQVSSGVCCCGDSMEGHPSPMTCGHSPVDMWDYHSGELLEAYPDDLSALLAHDEKLRAAFQAGTASRDAEIQRLQFALSDTEALECGTAEKCDKLRAQINSLREALEKILSQESDNGSILSAGNCAEIAYEALASIPEQSLAEYRNKVIEAFVNEFSRHVGGDGEFWLHELQDFDMKEQP